MGQLVNRRRRAIVGLASMFGGAACLVATIPGQASADPPGNNGTVKIDGAAFDDHPDNEPHVGCIFQVDWYGFDEGEDLFSHVTFEVHPPTGKPVILLEDDVFIGEDDNSGGGSEAGLDASETYDLSTLLQGFEPHPQQGWHVKLTTNNDGSQGADVKHKVFWVSGCETPPTTTSTTSTTSTSTTSTTEQPTTTSTTEGPTTTSTTEGPTTTSTTEQPTTTSTTEGRRRRRRPRADDDVDDRAADDDVDDRAADDDVDHGAADDDVDDRGTDDVKHRGSNHVELRGDQHHGRRTVKLDDVLRGDARR